MPGVASGVGALRKIPCAFCGAFFSYPGAFGRACTEECSSALSRREEDQRHVLAAHKERAQTEKFQQRLEIKSNHWTPRRRFTTRGKKTTKKYVKLLEKEIQRIRTNKAAKSNPRLWGFYGTRGWRQVRYRVLKNHGRKCSACGTQKGAMHVDHIKPRAKFPELELVEANLQILCADCNIGKGAWDQTDWRKNSAAAGVRTLYGERK